MAESHDACRPIGKKNPLHFCDLVFKVIYPSGGELSPLDSKLLLTPLGNSLHDSVREKFACLPNKVIEQVTLDEVTTYLCQCVGLTQGWLWDWVRPFIRWSRIGMPFNTAAARTAVDLERRTGRVPKVAQRVIDYPGDRPAIDLPRRSLSEHIASRATWAALVD